MVLDEQDYNSLKKIEQYGHIQQQQQLPLFDQDLKVAQNEENEQDYCLTIQDLNPCIRIKRSYQKKLEKQKKQKSLSNLTKQHQQGCNCTKSQCLKRYCPCFHNDQFCTSECGCKGCKNNTKKIDALEIARQHVFRKCWRNKKCPRQQLLQSEKSYGCTCTKRECQSGYCDCFIKNQKCDSRCSCFNCCNQEIQILGEAQLATVIDEQIDQYLITNFDQSNLDEIYYDQ